VRQALNSAIYALLASNEIDVKGLRRDEDLLRIRDPSDASVKRAVRPDDINWIDGTLADGQFVGFADLALGAALRIPNNDWVTLFEYTEQRLKDDIGSLPSRVHRCELLSFGVPRGRPLPSKEEMALHISRGALAKYRNLYRQELAKKERATQSDVVPIFVWSNKAFRGRQAPYIAALVQSIARRLLLTSHPVDPFGYEHRGVQVVRSVEWQDAFDQGRRRHEPLSTGFRLQMHRHYVEELKDNFDLDLGAYINAYRTTDKYVPEHKMKWHRYQHVFPVAFA
jgi:hypothetical protein